MDPLQETVRRAAVKYAGEMLNGYSYLTSSEDGLVFTVADIAKFQGKHTLSINLVVRIGGDQVVIERDQNDKLVVDSPDTGRYPAFADYPCLGR